MNPEQVSKYHRIVEQVQTYLHQALRSLCSAQAQFNISLLIRERRTKFPPDVLKEVIFQCDLKHPLRSLVKLPGTLIFLSAHDNFDINLPMELLTAAFGSFNTSDSSPRQPRSSSRTGRHFSPSNPKEQRRPSSRSSPSTTRGPQAYSPSGSSGRYLNRYTTQDKGDNKKYSPGRDSKR